MKKKDLYLYINIIKFSNDIGKINLKGNGLIVLCQFGNGTFGTLFISDRKLEDKLIIYDKRKPAVLEHFYTIPDVAFHKTGINYKGYCYSLISTAYCNYCYINVGWGNNLFGVTITQEMIVEMINNIFYYSDKFKKWKWEKLI